MMKPVYFGSEEIAEGDGQGNDNQPHTFFTEVSSKLYEHYMDYDLTDFTLARQLCTLLRGVDESDTVVIRINSMGGRFDVAAQIMNAIRESKAQVVGVIEQECASAATMIFLVCDQWLVEPYGEMMIHYASYGAGGKGHEVSARVHSNDKLFPKVFDDVYKHFLSEEEIDNVIKGQDLYLTQDEIVSRLEVKAEHMNSQQEAVEYESEPEAEPEKPKKTNKRSQVSKDRKKS